MKPSVRKAKAVIAVSQTTRTDLANWSPDLSNKLSVVYESSFFSNNIERKAESPEPYVLFVGTFEPRKNLPRLLQAVRLIREQGEAPVRLILAGRDGWNTSVEQLISDCGLGATVKVIRSSSDQQLAELYQHCSFLVLPSIYEGFGLPLLEAMTFGKPILCSNAGALPEIAGNAALLVDPYDTQAIAAGLKRMLTDAPLRQRLSEHAQARAQEFSWDKAANETLTILQQAMRSG